MFQAQLFIRTYWSEWAHKRVFFIINIIIINIIEIDENYGSNQES
jgi:hypothetical protein